SGGKKKERGAGWKLPLFVWLCVGWPELVVVPVLIAVAEVEEVEEIADSRGIERHIGIVVIGNRIREVVTAASGERLQIPVAFDELEDGHVVGIGVADVAAARKGRNRNQGNAWAVAEEVQRLDVAGVVVAAALVHGDEQNGGGEELLVGGEMIHDFAGHGFKEVFLCARRVRVAERIRLLEGNIGHN